MGILRSLFLALVRVVYYKLTHVQEEKWRVLAGCLLLSGCFWFLRQMNNTYTTTIKIPISLQYDAKRYSPQTPVPTALWMYVAAQGWPLAMVRYGPKKLRVAIVPTLTNGMWQLDTASMRRFLEPKLQGVHIHKVLNMPETVVFTPNK